MQNKKQKSKTQRVIAIPPFCGRSNLQVTDCFVVPPRNAGNKTRNAI